MSAFDPVEGSTPKQDASARTETVLERLHAELFKLKDQDDYVVLGLSHGADDAAIRAAYLKRSKRYHPHRYARYNSAEHRRVATELYVLVQRAYARLSGSERMPSHDGEQRKRAVRRTARDELDRITSEAVALLQHNQHDEAIHMLSEVVQQDPNRANARLWLMIAGARLALAQDNKEQAIECYKAVIELQPGHAEARDQLLQLTVTAEPERPGLLGRLFRRKG